MLGLAETSLPETSLAHHAMPARQARARFRSRSGRNALVAASEGGGAALAGEAPHGSHRGPCSQPLSSGGH